MALELKVTRGDTLTWRFTMGADITGWAAKFIVKPLGSYDVADGSATYSGAIGTGLTVVDLLTGVLDLLVPGTSTLTWVPGAYMFSLQLTKAGEVRTVEWDSNGTVVGQLIVSPGAVKSW